MKDRKSRSHKVRPRTPDAWSINFPVGNAPYWRLLAMELRAALEDGRVDLGKFLFTLYRRGFENGRDIADGNDDCAMRDLDVQTVTPFGYGMRMARAYGKNYVTIPRADFDRLKAASKTPPDPRGVAVLAVPFGGPHPLN